MRIVRDRADARWLPSRFNFALFRLFAYLRLRASRPESRPGLILSIERHQSAAENYIVCIAMIVVVWSLFRSPLLGVTVAIIGLQLAIVTARTILRMFFSADANTVKGGSILIVLAIVAGAIAVVRTSSVAKIFLAVVALNAIAAAIMFLLRGSVARVERQFE